MAFKRPKPPDTAAPFVDRTGRITTEWYRFIQQLFTDSTTAAVAVESGAAGATTLDELTDVTITDVEDGQTIIYDELTGQWINGGAGGVDGTGADNQVAVWADSDTIEGGSNLTFDGTSLKVGTGASGATISTAADDIIIGTSSTADIGLTITDAGTASNHRIEMRSSDDKFGFIWTGHDGTSGASSPDYGIRIGYDDGTDEMALELDFDRNEFQFFSKTAPSINTPIGYFIPAKADNMVLFHNEAEGGMTILHAIGGESYLNFADRLQTALNTFIGADDTTVEFLVGVNGTTMIRLGENGFKLREASAADADTAAFGQFWVKDDAPNIPKFTDDGGTDYSIVLDTKTQTLTNKTIVAANNTLTLWEQHADNPKASTSGTALDWTGIPDNVQEIVVSFVGVSTNGTSPYIIQLGDSGGIETSGYTSRVRGTGTSTDATAGFIVTTANHAAADVLYGEARISRVNAGLGWTCTSSTVGNSRLFVASGYKAVSATLDRIRLTTVGGTDTFDAGSVSVKFI